MATVPGGGSGPVAFGQLELPPKRADISIRKDPNSTSRQRILVRKTPIVNIPPQIKFNNAFQQNQAYTAPSILEFCRGIMYNWFPQSNFTRNFIQGSLNINGNSVGNLDFVVVPGQTVTANIAPWFSSTEDTASSFIFVKGNLSIDAGAVLQPYTRKLFTVLYISGDLTFGDSTSAISMTQRGANHSGQGNSGGATTEVDIKVGSGTTIAANGAAGAAGPNTIEESARQGINGSTTQTTLQTGGGGGGWWDYKTIT